MLTYETFQSLCPNLLTFLFYLYGVIVANYFFYRFPKDLDHFAHIICFTTKFYLLVLQGFFLFYFTFSKLFTAHPYTLLCIILLFLVLAIEICLHPVHFLKQEFKVGPTSWRSRFLVLFLRELIRFSILAMKIADAVLWPNFLQILHDALVLFF